MLPASPFAPRRQRSHVRISQDALVPRDQRQAQNARGRHDDLIGRIPAKRFGQIAGVPCDGRSRERGRRRERCCMPSAIVHASVAHPCCKGAAVGVEAEAGTARRRKGAYENLDGGGRDGGARGPLTQISDTDMFGEVRSGFS